MGAGLSAFAPFFSPAPSIVRRISVLMAQSAQYVQKSSFAISPPPAPLAVTLTRSCALIPVMTRPHRSQNTRTIRQPSLGPSRPS